MTCDVRLDVQSMKHEAHHSQEHYLIASISVMIAVRPRNHDATISQQRRSGVPYYYYYSEKQELVCVGEKWREKLP